MEIEAQQNIIDLIETEVVNNQLLIKKENHGIIADWQSVKVYISLPEIQGLTLAGSGNLTANTAISSPQLELKISGSGGLYLPKLETNEVTATISGSGDLQIDEGYADKEILQITGSGNLHLLNLESRLSEIKITASGNADVWVTENLSVRITGSGNVRYKGNPLVDTDITGSGSVQPY